MRATSDNSGRQDMIGPIQERDFVGPALIS